MRKLSLALAVLTALLFVAVRGASAQTEPTSAATLRIVHAAIGAPGVDIYLDGQAALKSRDFFSEGALSLAPGDHEVLVVRAGEAPASAFVGKRFNADAGEAYTLALIGDNNVRGLLLKDRTSAPESDEARVRIIHAATGVGAVDVAVAGAEPFLQDAVFGSSTYIDVPIGTYAFDLAAADTGVNLLQTLEFSFEPGWVYTLVVTGNSPESVWVQALVDRAAP
ncbi:MAG: DUF4397 domain-containing protein [Chloroflexales bacterium]|nr:DUF4397 domain-containing protein [Chloroflexales bacterium]